MSIMKRVLIIFAIAVVTTIVAWVWFCPSGDGEYADSPNGRYRAWAWNYHRGTWFHGSIEYIGIEIVDVSTDRVVWYAERYAVAGETPPQYGDRSQGFIKWAKDSRSVSVPVGAAADAVWIVP
jgi:hypothetical protein